MIFKILLFIVTLFLGNFAKAESSINQNDSKKCEYNNNSLLPLTNKSEEKIVTLQNALTKTSSSQYEMNLKIELSSELLQGTDKTKEQIEENIRKKIAKSEECINKAFADGKSDVHVEIKIPEVTWLDSEELKLRGVGPITPDLDKKGNIVEGIPGNLSKETIMSFYNINGNHVPWVFNKTIQTLMKSKDFKPILLAESLEKEAILLNQKYEKDPTPELKIALDDLRKKVEIAEENEVKSFKILESKGVHFEKFPISNHARIELNEARSALDPDYDGNLLAHELMHAYGGLIDNYTDPSHTAPNLMGAYGGGNTCILTPEQIKAFTNYRSQKH